LSRVVRPRRVPAALSRDVRAAAEKEQHGRDEPGERPGVSGVVGASARFRHLTWQRFTIRRDPR
jgi:hypothetical protein